MVQKYLKITLRKLEIVVSMTFSQDKELRYIPTQVPWYVFCRIHKTFIEQVSIVVALYMNPPSHCFFLDQFYHYPPVCA